MTITLTKRNNEHTTKLNLPSKFSSHILNLVVRVSCHSEINRGLSFQAARIDHDAVSTHLHFTNFRPVR